MLTKTREKLEELGNRLEQRMKETDEKVRRLQEQLEKEREAAGKRVRSLELRVDDLERRLDGYENVIINLQNNNARLETMEQTMERILARQSKLERIVKERPDQGRAVESGEKEEGLSAPVLSSPKDSYMTIDYFDFENHFRGSREAIKERQKQYLACFTGRERVVDIGCGRGEFLELLKEEHIPAVGVDTYEEFVDYCKEKGFEAVWDDGIHYLKMIDRTDGIFAGQVVEHLTPEQIMELCATAYEKLDAGASLVIETPNPTSLAIYTHAFYVDPSHVKPVHPLTMEYYMQKAGFRDIKIVYTRSSRLPIQIPELKSENRDDVEAFNNVMKEVSELLFGSQDYAIIATK